ncbi:MAG: CoA ester lyase [Hyphomicrobiaceae bacterium]
MVVLTLRTPLFVPGDRPDRFAKAAASGADAVILDLEDAVTPDNKDKARASVAKHAVTHVPVVVRINPLEGPLAAADIAALEGVPIAGVMIAKAADPVAMSALAGKLPGVSLVALIESAAGVAVARALAAVPGVVQLAFGSIDYALDIDCEETFEALLTARSEVVLASRLAGIRAPLDGVTVSYEDAARLTADARQARMLGFGGKLLIHPKQLDPVRAGFAPSEEEVAWAREVIEAVARQGEGAISVRGRMVDAPVIGKARRILGNVP